MPTWATGTGAMAMSSILPTIVDVSSWQGGIAWADVKPNVHFAIVRVQDGTHLDGRLRQNVSGCEQQGIPYYLYGFYRNGGAVEAARMVSRAREAGATGQRGYVLDVEVSGQSTANIRSAMATLNASGLDNGIYIANHLYPEYGGEDYGEKWRWIPAYGANDGRAHTPPRHRCDLWQFTSAGRVPGIGGNVDCNALNGKRTLASFTTDAVSGKPVGGDAADGTAIDPTRGAAELVGDVLAGDAGNGDVRRARLGSRYDEIQALVNHVLTESASTLAQEVIDGEWGDGETRRRAMGARYDEVQEKVNARLGASSPRTYTVRGGDTLSAIASRNGTTVSAILAKNPSIKNANLIYAGQAIRL